jgi:hypothetical protein
LRPNFVVLVVSMGAVVAFACAAIAWSNANLAGAEASSAAAKKELGVCYGAGAVRHPHECRGIGTRVVTDPTVAREDLPFVYHKDCRNTPPYDTRKTCEFGANKNPKLRIALVGNSHASHWIPALQKVLTKNPRAQVTTYLASYCYTVDLPVRRPEGDCQEYERSSINAVAKGNYDLIVMSNRMEGRIAGVPSDDEADVAARAYRKTLREFRASGAAVMVIRDTPFMVHDVPDCIAENDLDWSKCRIPRSTAVERDPAAEVGETMKGIYVLNLTNYFCDESYCNPVVGRAIAYSDHGHLTADFSRTLAPEICHGMVAATSSGDFDCNGLEPRRGPR